MISSRPPGKTKSRKAGAPSVRSFALCLSIGKHFFRAISVERPVIRRVRFSTRSQNPRIPAVIRCAAPTWANRPSIRKLQGITRLNLPATSRIQTFAAALEDGGRLILKHRTRQRH